MTDSNFEIQGSHYDPGIPPKGDKKIEEELAEEIGKMYQHLRDIRKNLEEVIPQDRNFDIELQESDVGVSLHLKHKESVGELDLALYLPPAHFFGKDKFFYYRKREKKIGFAENELKYRGFLLSLFHEIGHSHKKLAHAATQWDDLRALGSVLKKWINYLTIAAKKEIQQKGSVQKFMETVKTLDVDTLLPQWYIDKETKSVAQSERDAWAYALQSLRKLKQEGYDVFAGFDNVAQISAYIAYCLYTYDADLFIKRLMSADIKALQESSESPFFWKKSKMYNR